MARRLRAVALVSCVVASGRLAQAQGSCNARADDVRTVSSPSWPAPLDRPVTVAGRELSLRDALDRLAAAARVRISYAADLLPLDTRVCLAARPRALGEALTSLVARNGVTPVVVGGQIVLAPSTPRLATAAPVPITTTRASTLERVVVTGSAAGGSSAQRALPVSLNVVSGQQLADRGASSLAGALAGAVPGLWVWEQSPTSLLARYGSIRGASSFGVSYPKVYIDGIEVANPLVVTQLDPRAIEHLEVIRGPQGAALYGADAISGVINIVTRHGGTDGGVARTELHSTAGVSGSEFATGGVLAQRHALSLRGGSGVRSAGLSLSLGSIGEFVRDSYARQLSATGETRLVGSRGTLTAVARFYGARTGESRSPLLTQVRPPPAPGDSVLAPLDSAMTQSLGHYTVGATGSLQASERWTHAVTLGIDGYRLRDASLQAIPFPSAADSALRAARGRADRGSLRLSSVARVGSDARGATVTLAAEHSSVRDENDVEEPYGPSRYDGGGGGGRGGAPNAEAAVSWRHSTGLIAQTTASFAAALFVTGGLRIERSIVAGESDLAALPMVGVSWVRELGATTLKLRGAYGRGIRAPQTTSRATSWLGIRRTASATALDPEEQSGVEVGADLLLGRGVALHLTRFDQTASGLIQPVALAMNPPPGAPSGPPPNTGGGRMQRRIPYQLQNVGEIANRGWEMEGSWSAGALSVAGTMSFVDSRVERLARGYTGDLLPGDRMLEVPARSAALSATWSAGTWSTSWSASRAFDWINYDRFALAESLAASPGPVREPVGSALRTYWRAYDGRTRLRATFRRDVGRGVALVVEGENLLGQQFGEPDNVTVIPGRTITGGLRVRF